jgi:hypothetical protein
MVLCSRGLDGTCGLWPVEDLEWEREGTGTRLESGEWEKRRGGKRSGAEYLRPGQIVLEGKFQKCCFISYEFFDLEVFLNVGTPTITLNLPYTNLHRG